MPLISSARFSNALELARNSYKEVQREKRERNEGAAGETQRKSFKEIFASALGSSPLGAQATDETPSFDTVNPVVLPEGMRSFSDTILQNLIATTRSNGVQFFEQTAQRPDIQSLKNHDEVQHSNIEQVLSFLNDSRRFSFVSDQLNQ
ncbi:MAG: hypothetical protein RIR18_335 [Pseudomonadota bacterium]